MKKYLLTLMAAMSLYALIFTGCAPSVTNQNTPKEQTVTQEPGSYTAPADATDDTNANWALINYSLQDFNNKLVTIDFSCDMKVNNKTNETKTLSWNITIDGYPVIASNSFEAGQSDWVKVSSTDSAKAVKHQLGTNTQLYLNGYGLKAKDVDVQVKNVSYKISYNTATSDPSSNSSTNWLSDEVPSIKETYKDYFDSIGIACEYDSWAGVKELSVESVRNGIKKHADSVSMGNELKPESIFGYKWTGTGKSMVKFNASNGEEIQVPANLEFDTVDKCLAACKASGLKMRGHVLAWHAQTPEAFFTENYAEATYKDENQNVITNRVSKKEMQARLEWYIKTVLTHVADWEATNNNGEHIIWAWDVFNETVADDADSTNWVRGSTPETKNRPPAAPDVNPGPCGSRWYQCYEDTDFIVDAFRYANAYAPADVKLCYNDYNEYMTNKTDGILKLINLVKKGSAETVNGKSVKPRLDVMGLQSHVGNTWPGVTGYEEALKKYLEVVDCHVTEFDIAAENVSESKTLYKDYFKMLKKYGKKYSGSHKITNVTIWGINNKSSWIYKGNVKYPLLFDNYNTTDAFWAVIEAAE